MSLNALVSQRQNKKNIFFFELLYLMNHDFTVPDCDGMTYK